MPPGPWRRTLRRHSAIGAGTKLRGRACQAGTDKQSRPRSKQAGSSGTLSHATSHGRSAHDGSLRMKFLDRPSSRVRSSTRWRPCEVGRSKGKRRQREEFAWNHIVNEPLSMYTRTAAWVPALLASITKFRACFLREDAKRRRAAQHIMTDAALLERLNAAEYAACPAVALRLTSSTEWTHHTTCNAGFASACARTTSSVSCSTPR